MVVCCKCNRTGHCRNCACVKAGRRCLDCLPARWGHCSNALMPPVCQSQASTPSDIVTTTITTTTPVSSSTAIAPPVGQQDSRTAPPQAGTTSPQAGLEPDLNRVSDRLSLPSFKPANVPVFVWGDRSARDFTLELNEAYKEVVHWKKNTFNVPFGSVGKEFVQELSRLFAAFGHASSMESIALRAAIVMPNLLLQQPFRGSKVKNHISSLQQRMKVWKEGNLYELLAEGRAIQNRLPVTRSTTSSGSSR